MGQKTHPYGFRLVYNKTWHSRWYAEGDYSKLLHSDLKLRADLKKRLGHAGVSEIVRIAAGLTTLEQLGTMLAHESPKINDQVQVMLAIEQRRVVFLVLSDFHAIPSEEQPVIAGLLHRFSKNLPVYLRILSLSELVLFRRDSTGEAGRQRDHDYVEFRQS